MPIKRIIVGIDPGVSGGITILGKDIQIFPIPITKNKVGKTNAGKDKFKTEYDWDEVVKLFKKIQSMGEIDLMLAGIEKVHAGPGEGSVSMFGFGKGYGFLLGAIKALGWELVEVSPQMWKKEFPELITQEIHDIKQQQKDLRKANKTEKDKAIKSGNTKEIERLGRRSKSIAKSLARELAADLAPDLKDMFKLVKSDGLAESLLIAEWTKQNYGKLV